MASNSRAAAIGWKTHIGWAMAVAIAVERDRGDPVVLFKRRVDVATTFDEGAIYHGAQGLPLASAESMLRSAEARLAKRARLGVAAVVEEVRAGGWAAVTGGLVGRRLRSVPPLESILRSHALVHAAEGDLYRRLFAQASEGAEVPLTVYPSRELAGRAAAALHLSEDDLAARLAAIGKRSGRPWATDHKESALAAWLALATRRSR